MRVFINSLGDPTQWGEPVDVPVGVDLPAADHSNRMPCIDRDHSCSFLSVGLAQDVPWRSARGGP